jgi:hypothetical protein
VGEQTQYQPDCGLMAETYHKIKIKLTKIKETKWNIYHLKDCTLCYTDGNAVFNQDVQSISLPILFWVIKVKAKMCYH